METNIKCPKCRSNNLLIDELWINNKVQFIQDNGKININDTNMEAGEPYKMVASCCNCNHVWTIRKAKQIIELKENK